MIVLLPVLTVPEKAKQTEKVICHCCKTDLVFNPTETKLLITLCYYHHSIITSGDAGKRKLIKLDRLKSEIIFVKFKCRVTTDSAWRSAEIETA